MSYFGGNEGLHLDADANTFKVPREYNSILEGYSSADKNDPGQPIELQSNDERFLIQANCLREKAYSFSPAVIIPLPPIIPLFGLGSGSVEENVNITVSMCTENAYIIESIIIGATVHRPISTDNCSYKFKLMCNEIPDGTVIIASDGDKEVEIKVRYIKTLTFGWGWLGA